MSSRSAALVVVSKMGMAASAASVPISSPEAPVTSRRSGPTRGRGAVVGEEGGELLGRGVRIG